MSPLTSEAGPFVTSLGDLSHRIETLEHHLSQQVATLRQSHLILVNSYRSTSNSMIDGMEKVGKLVIDLQGALALVSIHFFFIQEFFMKK